MRPHPLVQAFLRRPASYDRRMDRGDRAVAIVALCCGVFLVSLAALTTAFVTTLASASRNFDRAVMAQAQLAAVSRIEMLATSGDAPALNASLAAYRRSIREEDALLPSAERAAQVREASDADRLGRFAADPVKRKHLSRQAAVIAARERAEAATMAAAMARLRARTTRLAVLLAFTASGAALFGAFALLAANRRLKHEVAAKTAELAAIDSSRRLFFAKASHEMRTPLTVMRGEAEVALADADAEPASLREALTHVVANAEFLEHRIAELLALARADDGQVHLEDQPIDLRALVDGARRAAQGYARSAEVAIALTRLAEPIAARGDFRWLQQAVLAIIDNAVKFSPLGATVRLALMRTDDLARIQISDQGVGVAEHALPHIFDAYYQADAGRARGGTGLGLALARWVVERHGGSISAANVTGDGCTVTIDLPIARR